MPRERDGASAYADRPSRSSITAPLDVGVADVVARSPAVWLGRDPGTPEREYAGMVIPLCPRIVPKVWSGIANVAALVVNRSEIRLKAENPLQLAVGFPKQTVSNLK